METFTVAHKNLQMYCADFWSTPTDCLMILTDIGVDSARINMAEPAIMRWLSIIRELMRKDDGSMGRLVVSLMKQYPENKSLREVCAPWIPSAPAKSIATANDVDVSLPPDAVLVKKYEAGPEPEPAPDPKPAPKPAPKPELVPVVVAADFADDAPLTVARIETLWLAMVDTENRIREIEEWRNSLFSRPPAKKKA